MARNTIKEPGEGRQSAPVARLDKGVWVAMVDASFSAGGRGGGVKYHLPNGTEAACGSGLLWMDNGDYSKKVPPTHRCDRKPCKNVWAG